ncbi:MAG: hypothetical protein JWO87_3229 [Phycisphaerales bacterium]|nr:hypothetical protein [Phycisphaerales bacterium]MDB5301566.1 hypothetical protein [Phycisphaerales bacterium]MDB5305652.1 hypothetical protein [Phycisphaerales bacterium]
MTAVQGALDRGQLGQCLLFFGGDDRGRRREAGDG